MSEPKNYYRVDGLWTMFGIGAALTITQLKPLCHCQRGTGCMLTAVMLKTVFH